MSSRHRHRVSRGTSPVPLVFPSSTPFTGEEDLPRVEPDPVSPPEEDDASSPSKPSPGTFSPTPAMPTRAQEGTHCPAGYCPRCWEGGGAQALKTEPYGGANVTFCPSCDWMPHQPGVTPPIAAPAPFQTLLLPNRVPGVNPQAHVVQWSGKLHEVVAIASPEGLIQLPVALPPGVMLFFLRELP